MEEFIITPAVAIDVNGDNRWMSSHERHKREASTHQRRCDVLFIGDSIINHMQFTTEWRKLLQRGIRALNFGISGDRVEHVAWRVKDGDWLKRLEPKVVVIFVGTNNVNMQPVQVAEAIKRLVDDVESKCDGEILLPMLLPRGEHPNPLRTQNESVNQLLTAKYGRGSSSSKATRTVKLCLDSLTDTEGRMDHEIMHDYLHLTDRGYSLIFQPLFEEIYKWYEKQCE